MDKCLIDNADAVGLFCRLHLNTRKNMPIRSSEMGVLIFTQKQKTPVTPLMISQFFKIAKPSVTTMVNALIKGDYLIKEASLSDGRSYTLAISEKGEKLVEATFDEYYKTMELLKEKMGVDAFDELMTLIKKANAILGEVN